MLIIRILFGRKNYLQFSKERSKTFRGYKSNKYFYSIAFRIQIIKNQRFMQLLLFQHSGNVGKKFIIWSPPAIDQISISGSLEKKIMLGLVLYKIIWNTAVREFRFFYLFTIIDQLKWCFKSFVVTPTLRKVIKWWDKIILSWSKSFFFFFFFFFFYSVYCFVVHTKPTRWFIFFIFHYIFLLGN